MPRYKRNKDGYFRETFIVHGKTAQGNPKRIVVRDKDEAVFKKKLAEAKRLYSLGINLENETVYDWGARWLAVYKANVSITQKNHYAAKLVNDICPAIGHMRMRDVRPSHLQALLNGYSKGRFETVKKIKNALKQLFEGAEIEGIIERNPAGRLELPELTAVTRRPLTAPERAAVFEVAKKHKCGAYILTMLFCGLRRGECVGLLAGDVDLQKCRITISKSLNLRQNKGEISTTKAAKLRKRGIKNNDDFGIRAVPIPQVLLPFLAAQCKGKSPGDILFPKNGSGYPTKQTCTWWWRSFARQCHLISGAEVYRNQIKSDTSPFGAEVTPHYLRHTYATDLYAAGVDETAQKYFLGHSSSDVTDIYRKMNDVSFNRALSLINEYNATLYNIADNFEHSAQVPITCHPNK